MERRRSARQFGDRPRAREGRRPVPRRARRRHRPGAQAQDHRRAVHPRVRGGRRAGSSGDASTSSCRARSTRTWSSRAAPTTANIKSHHNVGGLPDDMEFELVEPLRTLFKDEVRAVGEELGLPEEIVWRQPFPGPGLAVRIIGDGHRASASRSCSRPTRSCVEEIKPAGLYREIWQSFAVLPDGAARSACRATTAPTRTRSCCAPVTSDDAMTADWARMPYDVLERISSRIINEVRGRQPRRLRHHVEAARHHRVGVRVVTSAADRRPSSRAGLRPSGSKQSFSPELWGRASAHSPRARQGRLRRGAPRRGALPLRSPAHMSRHRVDQGDGVEDESAGRRFRTARARSPQASECDGARRHTCAT